MPIRQATAADIDILFPLFDLYRQFYDLPSDFEGTRAFVSERLQKKESVIFLAFAENAPEAPAGFAQLYPCFSSLAMKPFWLLNDLFITEKYRYQGLATDLLKAAEHFVRDTKAHGLSLQTGVNNIPAQRLYTSLGWSREEKFYTYNRICE